MDDVIEQLSQLAQEAALADPINWEGMNVSKDDVYKHMAKNVLDQMESVNEQERAVVAMATMTKLLVENFIYKARLESRNDPATNL